MGASFFVKNTLRYSRCPRRTTTRAGSSRRERSCRTRVGKTVSMTSSTSPRGDALRQVVDVARDHQATDVDTGGGETLAEAPQHLAEDPEHAVGLVRLLGDDAEAEGGARALGEGAGRDEQSERGRDPDGARQRMSHGGCPDEAHGGPLSGRALRPATAGTG